MEKSCEMEKTSINENGSTNTQNTEIKGSFQITQDVIDECLEPCIG